ncbi:putative oxidoreductase [Yersinia aldovae]|uniref:YceH family protein n=1 Tax=Yersinia aldovae TaxID=29483 RepID=UPI0005E10EB2|nr:YceH family protein [Yersinia aldovae]CNH40202.1 putative oxidoreductase [Yersinia aldovae]
MKHILNAQEARVIGSLLEKQVTTPEQYPMSLNGVTIACNQKTNREPVMALSDTEVQQTLDFLLKKHLIRTQSGNRVMKYEQRFCNSEFGNLKFSPAEVAVMTTLLLRGAQTPGELRTRTSRMYEFADVAETEAVLTQLSLREDGPFVVRLAREPGKRESRFMHLFSGDVTPAPAVDEGDKSSVNSLEARVAQLEQQVTALTRRLDEVLLQLDD